MQLTVACVCVDNYLGRGREYVDKLYSMVRRHLKQPFTAECLFQSDKAGWWAKIDLFRPGQFTGRVLYLDLDTVIVGPLDALANTRGIIHLQDWGWTKNDFGSGVMVWDAGEHDEIYSRFTADVPKNFRGDQDWLTHLGGWDALPFPMLCSAKYHCKPHPPAGASVVCFHGPKKPHNTDNAALAQHWY